MTIAKLLALLGLTAMTAALIFGFVQGDFAGEGAQLLRMPWGIVSLVDLYTGFLLFAGWVFYRESSLAAAVAWGLALMVLGFWAASLYALIALQRSRGDWKRFWLGKHAV
jgi:hypothetical protein